MGSAEISKARQYLQRGLGKTGPFFMPTFREAFGHFHKKKYKKLLTSGIRKDGEIHSGLLWGQIGAF